MRYLPYWLTVACLAGTTALLWTRGSVDRVPSSRPLNTMPAELGPWVGVDIPLEGYVLDVLGNGIFLNRNYMWHGMAAKNREDGSAGQAPNAPIGLFIAYFPTQRAGSAIHSPQNCLPGAGWVFASSSVLELRGDDGRMHQVGDYVIENGHQRDEVFYWYQERGRSISSDYTARWYTLLDSIREHRTDAALIRVITPIAEGQPGPEAHRQLVSFTKQLFGELPSYVPE